MNPFNFFRRVKSADEQKASATAGLRNSVETTWMGLPSPQWSSRTYDKMSHEGYRNNVIAHRSIRILAECAASVPFVLYRGDERLNRHPMLDVLKRPNPSQSGKEFLESLFAFQQIAGNAYVEAVETATGAVGELYTLRPDRMTIVPGAKGWPARYDYQVGAAKHSFHVDAISGQSPILHLKTFHPQDDHYGLSPLEAAAYAIDIHNAAQGWNKALLDNAARPSGALVFDPKDGQSGSLSDEQFSRLKDELEENYQGAKNAGRPFLLEGGLKWQQVAMSPQDMEFIQSKHVSAREIALAFGVPPMILGIPGDNTYANYQEANRALWRLTLLPLIEKTLAALNGWLAPRFGDDLALKVDMDAIPALAVERETTWRRVNDAQFLTLNEKRQALGYEPVPGGDVVLPSSSSPHSPKGNGEDHPRPTITK